MAFDLSEMVDAACQTMSAAAATLEKPAEASVSRATKQHVVVAAQQVRDHVAKWALISSQQQRPGSADLLSLLKTLEQLVVHLCYTMHRTTVGAGQTLQRSTRTLAAEVVSVVVRFVHAAILEGGTEKSLLLSVGVVFSQCDALSRMAADNRTAIGRELTRVAAAVKDTQREMDVMIQQAGSTTAGSSLEQLSNDMQQLSTSDVPGSRDGPACTTPDTSQGVIGLEDEEEDDELLSQDQLDERELLRLNRGKALLSSVLLLLKTLVGTLLAQNSDSVSGEALSEWESMAFNCEMLGRACDDFGSALMCPPHDMEELESATEAVINTCQLMAEECPISSAREAMQEALKSVEDAQKGLLET